ncbi:septum formation initiator [Solwaraspora sp. WMMD792]|uniref:septum formation initiator n=1 Tax=Solwaraspora sp. WMMD792 TaxID=3016099 RepID=UPI002417DF7F|nr:septum formation initiator [Solwaraspora sp. WMMD792]MDG4771878.1 septum formation initiator [Solwaraspora sp. WMMD792]
MTVNRRVLLTAAGWGLAAGLATLIAVAAVRVVGEGLTGGPGGEVLSQDEIARELAATSGPTVIGPATPSPVTSSPATPSPDPTGGPDAVRRAAATPGGTVVAECAGGRARLVSWAPAQGYRATDVDRGPDDDVEVSFVGPAGEYEVDAVCFGDQPEIGWELDD